MVPSCAEGGVLGVLPGIIGCIQATEALKILLGVGETLSGRLLLYDALSMRFRELKLRRDPKLRPPTHLIDYQAFCGVPKPPAPGQGAEASAHGFARLGAAAVAARLAEGWAPHWIDVRKPQEWALVQLARAERFVPHEQVVAEGQSQDIALLLYTSGTTGAPKGVITTHGSLLHNAELIGQTVQPKAGCEYLSYIPLSWATEQWVGVTLGLAPVNGITLPLVSYGGTSLLSTLLGLAVVFVVHRDRYAGW
jgi:hypothetical protein